jgi:hypothetical protein
MPLALELSEEGKRKDKEAKDICQCAMLRKIAEGEEFISCSDFRGINPEERLYANMGPLVDWEICPATEFHKRVDGEYNVIVNLNNMKACNYCRSLRDTK